MPTRLPGAGRSRKAIERGASWPVMLRPAGKHSSKGLKRAITVAWAIGSRTIPVSDTSISFSDGNLTQIQDDYVDGTVCYAECDAGPEWNPRKARVDMAARPETIAAEKAFTQRTRPTRPSSPNCAAWRTGFGSRLAVARTRSVSSQRHIQTAQHPGEEPRAGASRGQQCRHLAAPSLWSSAMSTP